ncbi:hypothetical protein NP493_175g01000 [Ridgeia piscesae]|uniref:Uncharacterized protein n=1 Tax=Ridgeia piscesae TaxID=27915 RepID=A0AAD9P3D3_RIDPI|nr:hypothetical protein NP493_175g01000 [Ridgeia piscesae]
MHVKELIKTNYSERFLSKFVSRAILTDV